MALTSSRALPNATPLSGPFEHGEIVEVVAERHDLFCHDVELGAEAGQGGALVRSMRSDFGKVDARGGRVVMADMRLEPFDQSTVPEVGVGDEHLPDPGRRGAITQAVLVSKALPVSRLGYSSITALPNAVDRRLPTRTRAVVLRLEPPAKLGHVGVGEAQALLDLTGAEVDPVAAV